MLKKKVAKLKSGKTSILANTFFFSFLNNNNIGDVRSVSANFATSLQFYLTGGERFQLNSIPLKRKKRLIQK